MGKNTHRLARAVCFAALVLGVHFGLRHLYLERVMPLDFPVERDRAFADVAGKIEVGLMGNSHVGMQLMPRDIPRSYNFAWLGEGYMVTYYRLQKLIREHGRPFGTLVLQLEQHSFSSAEMEQADSPYWSLYTDYLDLHRRTGQPWLRFSAWLQYSAFPYAGHAEQFARYFLNATATEGERLEPMMGDFSLSGDPEQDAYQMARWLFRGTNWYSDEVVEYFEAILELCHRHDIQVVLIRFPVSVFYWRHAAYHAPPNTWEAKVGRLLVGKPGVTLLDYHRLFLDRGDLFMDPHHLNRKGIEMFSARVGQDLSLVLAKTRNTGQPAAH